MGMHAQGFEADVINLAGERSRRKIERHMGHISTLVETGPELAAFYRDKMPEMVNMALNMAFNPLALFRPRVSKKLSMTMGWIDREVGFPDFCKDYIHGGKTVLSRYNDGADLRDVFSRNDDGWRIFTMDISEDCRTVTFFHGDLRGENGVVLEWSMGNDGDYFSTAFYERRDGQAVDDIEMDEETIGGFLHEITPSMVKQHRQSTMPKRSMRLV